MWLMKDSVRPLRRGLVSLEVRADETLLRLGFHLIPWGRIHKAAEYVDE